MPKHFPTRKTKTWPTTTRTTLRWRGTCKCQLSYLCTLQLAFSTVVRNIYMCTHSHKGSVPHRNSCRGQLKQDKSILLREPSTYGVCIGRSMPAPLSQSSGAVWKSKWPSWAFRPNEPYGFCGRKAKYWTMLRHWSQFVPNVSTDIRNMTLYIITSISELRSCVKVEVAVLGSRP